MSSVREDFESFQQFAAEQLAMGEPASLDELFIEWHDRRHQDEINQAIRRGFADVNNGRYESAAWRSFNIQMELIFGHLS